MSDKDNDNNTNNDKPRYDPVKLPKTLKDWMEWNRNCDMCIQVCRPPTEHNRNPGCKTMCLVRALEPTQQPTSLWQYNPLRNYAISVKATSYESPPSIADITDPDYNINLGEQLDRVGRQASHVAKMSYDASKNYVDSWKDGTQATFFRRVYEVTTNKDQFQLLRDHAKKTIDVFWNGDDNKNNNNKRKDSNNKEDEKKKDNDDPPPPPDDKKNND
ncbi:hypothetical protein LRAMOSA02166 [Lichtheimia ramosa]|uniref:Uncharacterized protein n=1 Tax=Lichtheimia ramosa TaxID=688394 RepID=A0A077WM47_9FUNG|nr:hypothetical protein LRAMOSA02166 [Lichtheimia ramosa]